MDAWNSIAGALQTIENRKKSGERAGIRTLDLLIKSQLLYRLSYALPSGAKGAPRKCAEHRQDDLPGQPRKWGGKQLLLHFAAFSKR